jgi:RimJ/RimL family protein N-acetyltransferase
MEYLLPIKSKAVSDSLIEEYSSRIADLGWGFWAVELMEFGVFAGFVGIKPPKRQYHFSPCIEIGWRLDSAYWGLGYASEAARASLFFGFDELRLEEIVSFTSMRNENSISVMNRIGLAKRGNQPFHHPGFAKNHPLRAHWLYAARNHEWRQLASAKLRVERLAPRTLKITAG